VVVQVLADRVDVPDHVDAVLTQVRGRSDAESMSSCVS